jgi:AcrR family transcriptional regulator
MNQLSSEQHPAASSDQTLSSQEPTDQKPKKTTTREKLVTTAIQLLSQKWLSEVSVADICRQAGLSNGVFYRYFETKEQLFIEILEMYFSVLSEAFEDVSQLKGLEGLEALCTRVFQLTDNHRDLTSIFREGQYRYYEFERRINKLYEVTLNRILGSGLSWAQIIYAMAGVRFLAFRRTYHGLQVDPTMVTQFLARGVFDPSEPDWKKIFHIEMKPLPIKLEQTMAEQLIHAGKDLFGMRGYHDVNIHQVTERAKVSVGTFYNYFPGKEEFYSQVIAQVSHELRQAISQNLTHGMSRLELELQGMVLFAFYITNIDPSCYNLVREGEFVTPKAVQEYYDAFDRGYLKHMEGLKSGESRVAGNFLMGLSHYFGLSLLHDPGGYHSLAKPLIRELGTLLITGLIGE